MILGNGAIVAAHAYKNAMTMLIDIRKGKLIMKRIHRYRRRSSMKKIRPKKPWKTKTVNAFETLECNVSLADICQKATELGWSLADTRISYEEIYDGYSCGYGTELRMNYTAHITNSYYKAQLKVYNQRLAAYNKQ